MACMKQTPCRGMGGRRGGRRGTGGRGGGRGGGKGALPQTPQRGGQG